MRINCLFALSTSLLLFSSCSKSPSLIMLEGIESIIQNDPYTAYQELCAIDKDALSGNNERALYSLLFSISLDKNYIDVSSDSLIAPAISYYSKHGDNLHRFLSYYYQGRVFENAEDYHNALESYVKSEEFIDDAITSEYLSRLFSRKARVYYHQFANDKALEESRKAKEVSKELDDKRFYVHNCFDEIVYQMANSDLQGALANMDSLEFWSNCNNYHKNADYYNTLLGVIYTALPDNTDSVSIILGNYLEECEKEALEPDHLLLAGVYEHLGNYRDASSELMESRQETLFQEVEYNATLSRIHQGLGEYKEALDAFSKYESAVEKMNLTIFNNDVRYIEERYEAKALNERSKRSRIILSVSLLSLLVVFIVAIVLTIRRIRQYRQELLEAENEYGFLKVIMSSGQRPERIDELFNARLKALKPFITEASHFYSQSTSQLLKNLECGRIEMLRSAGLLYAMSFPDFVSALSTRGLNSEEIGLCSMYISGFSSKELAEYPNIGQLYKINVEIRKKLSIPANGPKLMTWLKVLFEESNRPFPFNKI